MRRKICLIVSLVMILVLVSGCAGKAGVNGINGIDGKNGINGIDGIDGENGVSGIDGKNGTNGENGIDGLTPFIGTNGNWWIGDTDTKIKAAIEVPSFIFKSVTLKENMNGAVQKGPFTSGTSINIYELNESFIQTGFSYNAMTTDNVGNFSLPKGLELSSNNLLFVAQGFYYNEISGKNSEVPLTLTLLSDISNQSKVNINLLTSLEMQRVMHLIDSGLSYGEASEKARNEILNIFYFTKSDMAHSQDLDITLSGDDNAILLAISVILQGYRTTSELSLLLSEIGNDIKTDGKLNNERLRSELINDAVLVKLDKVRENLETFYHDNNITVSVPNFEKYVNQFINSNSKSDDPYLFTKNITYPTMGLYGVNLLKKDLNELSKVDIPNELENTHFSVAANLPVGTTLKVVFTTITENNTVDSSTSLNSSEWAVNSSYACKVEDIPQDSGADGCPTIYTKVYESNNNYGSLDIDTQVYPYSPNGDDTHDMFRVDYFENDSQTPTFSKVFKWVE